MVNLEEFEIVDFIPVGAVVWNIGKHMPEGYIPFVYIDNDCHILQDRPKYAVKIDNAQIIMSSHLSVDGMTDATKKQFLLTKGGKTK
jgi:hypothetical protein